MELDFLQRIGPLHLVAEHSPSKCFVLSRCKLKIFPSRRARTHTWVLFEHDLVHLLFEHLLHCEPGIFSKVEECKILLQ